MFLLKACCRLELNLSPYLYQGNFKTLVVVVNIFTLMPHPLEGDAFLKARSVSLLIVHTKWSGIEKKGKSSFSNS